MLDNILATLNSAAFSLNIWSDLQNMWQYDFMRHAFEAGTIVALVAGIVGYFVVCAGCLLRLTRSRTSVLPVRPVRFCWD